jgi:hypothetical protein
MANARPRSVAGIILIRRVCAQMVSGALKNPNKNTVINDEEISVLKRRIVNEIPEQSWAKQIKRPNANAQSSSP